MAYLPKKQGDNPADGSSPYSSMGGAFSSAPAAPAAGSGGSGGSTGPAPTQAQSAGTGFVNPSAYLQANQGAAQGMVNTIAQPIEQAGQKYTTGMGAYQNDFNSGVASGKQASGWAGPTSFEGMNPDAYSKLSQNAYDASKGAGMANNYGGQQQLLAQHYGGGQSPYTGGQQGFDAFLTGAAGGDRLNTINAQYGNLGQAFSNARDAGNAAISSARQSPSMRNPARGAALGPDYGRNAPGTSSPLIAPDTERTTMGPAKRKQGYDFSSWGG